VHSFLAPLRQAALRYKEKGVLASKWRGDKNRRFMFFCRTRTPRLRTRRLPAPLPRFCRTTALLRKASRGAVAGSWRRGTISGARTACGWNGASRAAQARVFFLHSAYIRSGINRGESPCAAPAYRAAEKYQRIGTSRFRFAASIAAVRVSNNGAIF